MNDEKKKAIESKDMQWAARELLQFITVCPQIVNQGMGVEAFVEDLSKASEKYIQFFGLPNK